VVEVTFPKSVLSVSLSPSQGKYSFDPTSKILIWDVGEMEPGKTPSIKGKVVVIFPRNTHAHHVLINFFFV